MMYWIYACIAASSSQPASYTVSVRTVGISPRTSSSTVRCLPAVVLQVCDSASSRLFADFHRRSHIASVVLCHPSGVRICFCGRFPGFRPSRGSTAGLFYTAPPGLKFRLAYARKIAPLCPFKFRFIELLALTDKYLLSPLCENLFRL